MITVKDGDLLALVVEAHGGLRRWRELTSITARLSIGGELCQQKGWAGALDEIAVTIYPRVQRASLTPCTSLDRRGLFTSNRVAIETIDGALVSERSDPRTAFDDLDPGAFWDSLHLAYFVGCAMWTRLTVPFLLAEPGFSLQELGPWREDGATWRRVRALFPERIASYSSEQILYFSPEGLLRRHDYTLACVGADAIAEYTDEHQLHGGISFPTLRRAVRRQPDGTAESDPALVTIDIRDITTSASGDPG